MGTDVNIEGMMFQATDWAGGASDGARPHAHPLTPQLTEDDLALLWEAILNMFEDDRSAARGKMAVRELIIFRHDSVLGNAPAWKLFDLVRVERKEGVQPARKFGDYEVTVDMDKLPEGVTCRRLG